MVELDEERAVVSLGERPDAGDLATGKTLPEYRELAQVLEPWLEPLFPHPRGGPESGAITLTNSERRGRRVGAH